MFRKIIDKGIEMDTKIKMRNLMRKVSQNCRKRVENGAPDGSQNRQKMLPETLPEALFPHPSPFLVPRGILGRARDAPNFGKLNDIRLIGRS